MVSGTQILTTLEIEGIKSQVVNQPMRNTVSFVRYELSENDGIVSKTKVSLLSSLSYLERFVLGLFNVCTRFLVSIDLQLSLLLSKSKLIVKVL